MLADAWARRGVLRELRRMAVVLGDRIAQQGSVVTAHPGAFELDSQLPQEQAPKKGETACDRGRWQISYPRLHRLYPFPPSPWVSSQTIPDDSDTKRLALPECNA